jgi:hypothetical protein
VIGRVAARDREHRPERPVDVVPPDQTKEPGEDPHPGHSTRTVRLRGNTPPVIREELARIWRWEERHRRLVARLLVALGVTVVVDLAGAVLVWLTERHADGTDIHTYGDAIFFSTVQLLTISSQLRNPLTAAGRVVDVGLEVWAIVVVASIGGSFAAFFTSSDRS